MKKLKRTSLNLLVLLIIILPILSLPEVSYSESKFWPIIQCGLGASSTPCDFDDAVNTVERIINWFISIAASIGALTLAYAGAEILFNPSSVSKLEDAKKMFYKTLWGLFWILAAWILVKTLITAFAGSNDPNGALRFLK